MFRALNAKYFDGQLEEPIITIQSTPLAYGHITVGKSWCKGAGTPPRVEHRSRNARPSPIENITATLLHEMMHLWNLQNGIQDYSRGGERKRRRNCTATKVKSHSQIRLPLLRQQRKSDQRSAHPLHGLQCLYGASVTKPSADLISRRFLMYTYQKIFQSSKLAL